MLFNNLVSLWETRDSANILHNSCVDLVVAITYGTREHRLALATQQVFENAIRVRKRHYGAMLAFGDADNCFAGSAASEHHFKETILKNCGVASSNVVSGAAITNSITEAEGVARLLKEENVYANTILLVCTRIHSRRVRYIWEQVFPQARILIWTIPGDPDVEPDHPIKDQRNKWWWFLQNIAAYALTRWCGLDYMKTFVHKNAD